MGTQATETAETVDRAAPVGEGGDAAVRRLAWLAILLQPVFVAAWVIAGALEPGYSHAERGVSALAARGAENPWIVIAGLVALGLSLVALAPGLLRVLPRLPAARVAAALFALAGLGYVAAAALPLDCAPGVEGACAQGVRTWQHEAHLWVGLAIRVLLTLTPFAIAAALWPRPVALAAFAAGVAGLVIGVGAFLIYGVADAPGGLVQRAEFLAVHVWVVQVAIGILHVARAPGRPSEPTPLPPREFFGGPWTGEGEAFLRPAFLWRRLALRFDCRRDATWVSDELGWFDDAVTFHGGFTESRRRFCQFVAPDRLRVTSDDLPDGAELTLEEAGYRIWPYRLLVPIGPLHIPLGARDQHRLDADGTLVDTLDLRLLGVPVATMIFRMRRTAA